MKVKVSISKNFLFIAGILIVLAVAIFVIPKLFHRSATIQTINELGGPQILSGTGIASAADIKTVQDIAKKQGVVVAYGYIKDTFHNNQIAGHDLAHVVGRLAYEQMGDKGFAVCDTDFAFGCYHGLLDALIKKEGDHGIEIARTGCNALQPQGAVYSCLHGLGHGVMSYTGEINKAITECGTFGDAERTYCYDGSYMEFYTGVMKGDVKDSALSTTSPWGFCLAQTLEAQTQCVRNQTLYLLYKSPNGATSVAADCLALSAAILRTFCVQTTGLYATQTANGDLSHIKTVCDNFASVADKSTCTISGAQEVVFQNIGLNNGSTICATLVAPWKQKCIDTITSTAELYGRK